MSRIGLIEGCFRWFSGVLCSALENGDWIILDELNLASQTVLEGLNSILDHRGEVFLAELGKAIGKAPGFRLFGCQNAKDQGNRGRKGLPLSFLNRFVRLYLEDMGLGDLLDIVRQINRSFVGQLNVSESLFEEILSFLTVFSSVVLETVENLGLPRSLFNIRYFLRCNKLFRVYWLGSSKHEANSDIKQLLSMILWSIFRTLVEPMLASKYANALGRIRNELNGKLPHVHFQFRINSQDKLECCSQKGVLFQLNDFTASRVHLHNRFFVSENLPQIFSIASLCSAPNLPVLCRLNSRK